jgi:hypothetical protein
MKTSELIAECRAALDDQSSLVTGDPDKLWSQERILRRLIAAQRIWARETWTITDDATAAVVQIALVAGQADYALHASVLGVLSARLSDTDRPLRRRSWNQIYGPTPPELDHWDTNSPLQMHAGRPQLFATDTATSKITFWRKPDAATIALAPTVLLRVARLPLNPLTLSTDSSPEIPEQYHIDLCDYVTGWLLKNTANNDTGEAQGEARRIGRSMLDDFDNSIRRAQNAVKRINSPTPAFRLGAWAGDDGC